MWGPPVGSLTVPPQLAKSRQLGPLHQFENRHQGDPGPLARAQLVPSHVTQKQGDASLWAPAAPTATRGRVPLDPLAASASLTGAKPEMPETNTVGAQSTNNNPQTVAEMLAQRPETKTTGAAPQRLLEHLAAVGGSAFLAELSRVGHAEQTVIAAATEDARDKRRKARVQAEHVGGEIVVWLTTPGWAAAGHPTQRERRPTTQSLAHADAPRVLRTWVAERVAQLGGAASVEIVTDPAALTSLSEGAKARAWARIQARTMTDSDGGVGILTGGLRPDALVVERWWNAQTWASAYQRNAGDMTADGLAEQVWAVEVENSTKSATLLRDKVARLDAAQEVRSIAGTIWVIRTAGVARALAAFQVGTEKQPRPGHFVVPATTIGLPGDLLAQTGPQWWPLRLSVSR